MGGKEGMAWPGWVAVSRRHTSSLCVERGMAVGRQKLIPAKLMAILPVTTWHFIKISLHFIKISPPWLTPMDIKNQVSCSFEIKCGGHLN